MEYAIAALERVRAKLATLPKPDERNKKLSKQDSIGFLAKELIASMRRGHTVEEIVAVLAGEGVEMSPIALKSHLQRARRSKRKRERPGRVSSPEAPAAEAGSAAQGVLVSGGTGNPGVAAVSPAARPPSVPPAPPRHVAGSKGSFLPGKDRDNL